MTYIGAPPTVFVIPVTLGADVEFSVNRVDGSGNPVDWDAVVSMQIDIEKGVPTVVTATVVDNVATVQLPHASICDQVKATTRWRMYMAVTTGDSTLTTPIAVGYFERDDGGSP